MSVEPPEADNYENLTFGLACLLCGALFAAAPAYLDATEGWARVWFVLAAFFALLGVVGVLIGLFGDGDGKTADNIDGLSIAIGLGVFAVGLGLIEWRLMGPSRLATVVKVAALVIAVVAILGTAMELSRKLKDRALTPADLRALLIDGLSRAPRFVVALAGVATVAVSIYRLVDGAP